MDIYVYGFELFLSSTITILVVLVISMIISNILYGLVFLAFFIGIRIFSGGFHADSFSKCFLYTNCSFLVVSSVVLNMPLAYVPYICKVLTVVSAVYIFIRSPIENRNNPLSTKKKDKNRKIARLVISLESLAIFICLVFISINIRLVLEASLAIGLVSLMMMIAYHQKGGVIDNE